MDYRIELTDDTDEALRREIIAPLVAYNTAKGGPSHSRPLVVVARNESGELAGGLWGHTAYEWLFTQFLVVQDSARGAGLGSKLMALAESEALARGCHGAWLDTFEFQARGFYEKNGYVCFAELPQYPAGYSRYFMKKRLRAEPSPAGSLSTAAGPEPAAT